MLEDISQTYFSYVKQMGVSVYMGQVHIIERCISVINFIALYN